MRLEHSLPHRYAITADCYHTVEYIRIHKQIFIDYAHGITVYHRRDILIVEFYLLHLRRFLPVASVDNAIAAEIVIGRTLLKVSAICLELLSIAVLLRD